MTGLGRVQLVRAGLIADGNITRLGGSGSFAMILRTIPDFRGSTDGAGGEETIRFLPLSRVPPTVSSPARTVMQVCHGAILGVSR